MKTMTLTELNAVVDALQEMCGAQFQDLGFDGSVFILRLWSRGETRDVVLDLSPTSPALVLAQQTLGKIKRVKPTPLGLFLKSHFVGQRLIAVTVDQSKGRVARMQWSGDPGGEIEIQLIPRTPNVIARWNEKTVSWKRPKPLTEGHFENVQPGRSLDQLWADWRSAKMPPQTSGVRAESKAKARLEREIQKLQKTAEKIRAEIDRRQSLAWEKVGHHLVAQQDMDVAEEWCQYLDNDRSLAWNIEHCFAEAKEQKRKLEGHRQRLSLIEIELQALQNVGDVDEWFAGFGKKDSGPQKRMSAALPRGRTLKLSDSLEAFAGKSGRDNLAILRQGRPWDLWVHIKDLPSSHAVIRRDKEQKVSDEDLRKVGRWLVELLSRPERFQGQRLEILVAECRHVRPVKGDRLGRVTFSNEKVLSFRTNG